MNRNWKIIAAIVAFMAVYQYTVIRPYSQKVRDQNKSSAAVAGKAEAEKVSNQVTEKTNVDKTLNETTNGPLAGPRGNFVEHSLSKDVYFKVYDNAVLSQFHLPNYQSHIDRTKDVVLLNDGIAWSSSNAAIQACLNALKPIDPKSNLSFSATTPQGQCFVNFELIEHSKDRKSVV